VAAVVAAAVEEVAAAVEMVLDSCFQSMQPSYQQEC
jgi:hypothetical protein